MPVFFAAILVFTNGQLWISVVAVILLFAVYFVVQFYFVKAKHREIFDCGVFTILGYVSVLFFMEENVVPRNYIGWFYLAFLAVYVSVTGVKELRKLARSMK